MHIKELVAISDRMERDRLLRQYLAPYSVDIEVDGAEGVVLTVLLNLTLKRGLVDDLCDQQRARVLLTNEKHWASCLHTVRWFHSHNLKYPDSRVSGQRLIVRSPPLITGIITSAGLPPRMGWAHNSVDINLAKLFGTSFKYHGHSTNLAEQLVARDKCWLSIFIELGMSKKRLAASVAELTANLGYATFPVAVNPYSKQVVFPYDGDYCSLTPVVSHSLMAHLQHVIRAYQLPSVTMTHAHPAALGGLVGSLGGKVSILYYPPPVSLANKTFAQAKNYRFADGHCLFDGTIFREKIFINALHNVVSRPGVSRRERRQLRLSALRYVRRQLAVWLGPLIELRDEVEQGASIPTGLPVDSLERLLLTRPQAHLSGLALQVASHFHLALQRYATTRLYAYHPQLLEPISTQFTWLFNQLARRTQVKEIKTSSCCYLHLSGLNVYDAAALANPYLCGIPSLAALAGFCHDYERRLCMLLNRSVHFTRVAWYLGRYRLMSGKPLPEPNKILTLKHVSNIGRPGVIESRCCDLGMDLIIEMDQLPRDFGGYVPSARLLDGLQAALPSRFAGGSLHPPSLYQKRIWCRVYQEQQALFNAVSRLPRSGCWIYPADMGVSSLEALYDAMQQDNRVRPVSTGYVCMEAFTERNGSRGPRHAYAESAIGTAMCINPIEMRFAGKKHFLNKGFWMLKIEDRAILMTGSVKMRQIHGIMHTPEL